MAETKRYEDAIKWIRKAVAGEVINRSGVAKLHRIVVGGPAAGTITAYDSPVTAASTEIAVIDSSNGGTYEYGLPLSTGLTVSGSSTADYTVIYE